MKVILLAQALEIQRQIAELRRHYAEKRRARCAAILTWSTA